MMIEVRVVSLAKAQSPIDMTEFGIVIEVRAVSPWKALVRII